jgi:hypothetical protein
MCSGIIDCIHKGLDAAMAAVAIAAFLIWLEAIGVGAAMW